MQKILFAWVGNADRNAPEAKPEDLGPIARALQDSSAVLGDNVCFDRVYLLEDRDDDASSGYLAWLQKKFSSVSIERLFVADKTDWNPGNFEAIWRVTTQKLECIIASKPSAERFYLVSSGTQAMGTTWVLVSRTAPYKGILLQASERKGLEKIELSFTLQYGTPPGVAQDIFHRSTQHRESLSTLHGDFVVSGTKMRSVVEQARRYARLDVPVLLLGENGTGKEVIAEFIHAESGREGKFISINCGALPSELVESELFGHVRGAFTSASTDKAGLLEAAGNGTVFLDEIADLPLPAQVKLLRALQEMTIRRVGETKEYSIKCRFIAATNKSLHKEIANKAFREDLYYRIAGPLIKIPPLRERGKEHIRALIQALWQKITAQNCGLSGQTLGEEAIQCLLAHNWPGNVRELNHTLIRAAVDAKQPSLSAADIEAALDRRSAPFEDVLDYGMIFEIGLGAYLKNIEDTILRAALEKAEGNQAKAGRLLKLKRATMSNKLRHRDEDRERLGETSTFK